MEGGFELDEDQWEYEKTYSIVEFPAKTATPCVVSCCAVLRRVELSAHRRANLALVAIHVQVPVGRRPR